MKIFFNLFLILICFSSKSQYLNIGGLFPTIDHSGRINEKLDYGIYYFGAFPLINFNKLNISEYATFHLLYLEQSLTYKKSEKISFTGSYLYQKENVLKSNYVSENRVYFQTKYKQQFTNFKLTHRFRFDARFVQNRMTNKSPFTGRLRYLIGFDKDLSEKYYFSAYEELFFNTMKNASPIYNENWAYLGIGKKLNEKNKLEIGLLYVTWNLSEKKWFNQFYAQVTWINQLDFNKNK
jgi:hypothetical protein